MSYQFPPDLEVRVKTRMNEGRYQSEDDLLRKALDALDRVEEERLTRWHERNQLAIEQSQQGLSKPLDDAAVLERLRKRLASEGILD